MSSKPCSSACITRGKKTRGKKKKRRELPSHKTTHCLQLWTNLNYFQPWAMPNESSSISKLHGLIFCHCRYWLEFSLFRKPNLSRPQLVYFFEDRRSPKIQFTWIFVPSTYDFSGIPFIVFAWILYMSPFLWILSLILSLHLCAQHQEANHDTKIYSL